MYSLNSCDKLTMRPSVAKALVTDIHRSLAPAEQFVTYQVRDTIIEIATEFFNSPCVSLVFWKVTPLRLYQFAKHCREKPFARPVSSSMDAFAMTRSFDG